MGAPTALRALSRVHLPYQDRERVGGRLRDCYRQWRTIGNKHVRQWIR